MPIEDRLFYRGMSQVRNGEQKEQKYLHPNFFYGGQKLHKYFRSLLIKGTSLLACLYIGELRNGRKFKCENKPFVVFILILSKGNGLDLIFF